MVGLLDLAEVVVDVGPVAHGGHCVARADGRVIFVRHALPGETVRVQITDTSKDRFWLGDAVEILKPSPDRIEPRCTVAGPGGCGGCDWQHAQQPAQRELKRAVVAEQLVRLANYAWAGEVENVEPHWNWRTRMNYVRLPQGQVGLRKHDSRDVIPVPAQGCAIAAPFPVEPAAEIITEVAAGRDYDVWADGFWQVHPKAADTLVDAVLAGLAPRVGESMWDLFCGVGLFAGAFIDAGCAVRAVEGNKQAVRLAESNVPEAIFAAGDVTTVLSRWDGNPDLVVLDPPRAGAGKKLMTDVCQRTYRAIAYVACDPASLARDLGVAQGLGWHIDSVRAFDLFPQTHHVECVAVLTRL